MDLVIVYLLSAIENLYETVTCRKAIFLKSMGSKFLQDIYLEYFVIFGANWL